MNVLDLHAKTVLLVKIFPEVTNVTVNPDLQAETAEKVNFTKMVITLHVLILPGVFCAVVEQVLQEGTATQLS